MSTMLDVASLNLSNLQSDALTLLLLTEEISKHYSEPRARNGTSASSSIDELAKARRCQQLGLPQLCSAALTIRISKVIYNTTKHLSPCCRYPSAHRHTAAAVKEVNNA